jgi:hydroxymethylglutaryl-CoA lyase
VPEYVRLTDVSPRDGLQNEPQPISTADKLRLIEALTATGVDEVELTSFVSPKWVPQLADAPEVVEAAGAFKTDRIVFSALVPNEQGLARAFEVNERVGALDKVAVFTAASESFSQQNTNASIDETLERFKPVINAARRGGLVVRGYISCAFACPFEGEVSVDAVTRVAARLLAAGVDEIDLGDTIGAATPEMVEALVRGMHDRLGPCRETEIGEPCLTLHLHDTAGRASECVLAALECGVRSFDGSAAGLGGCPYASTENQRAPGNIAMRVLVDTIEGAGYQTGVDRDALALAARIAASLVAAEGAM